MFQRQWRLLAAVTVFFLETAELESIKGGGIKAALKMVLDAFKDDTN